MSTNSTNADQKALTNFSERERERERERDRESHLLPHSIALVERFHTVHMSGLTTIDNNPVDSACMRGKTNHDAYSYLYTYIYLTVDAFTIYTNHNQSVFCAAPLNVLSGFEMVWPESLSAAGHRWC